MNAFQIAVEQIHHDNNGEIQNDVQLNHTDGFDQRNIQNNNNEGEVTLPTDRQINDGLRPTNVPLQTPQNSTNDGPPLPTMRATAHRQNTTNTVTVENVRNEQGQDRPGNSMNNGLPWRPRARRRRVMR